MKTPTDQPMDAVTVIAPIKHLIREQAAAEGARVFGVLIEADLDKLDDNPFQARAEMDGEKLEQLAQDIASHGLLEPIVVRRAGDRFQVIAGHRRTAAMRRLRDQATTDAERKKYRSIPAQVRADVDDLDMEELGLVENMQREDLSVLDRALAVAAYRDRRSLSTKEVAERLHESHDAVKALLRLCAGPQILKDGVSKGVLVTVLDAAGNPVVSGAGREKQERRQLDLSAADELGRLHQFWSSQEGAKKADARLDTLIHRVLRDGWGVRRVALHCKDLIAGRTPKEPTAARARAPFTMDERRLMVDLTQLASLEGDQKDALRSTLTNVLSRLQ